MDTLSRIAVSRIARPLSSFSDPPAGPTAARPGETACQAVRTRLARSTQTDYRPGTVQEQVPLPLPR
jgi:hypothetical protein